jgi:hypothetical protein
MPEWRLTVAAVDGRLLYTSAAAPRASTTTGAAGSISGRQAGNEGQVNEHKYATSVYAVFGGVGAGRLIVPIPSSVLQRGK